MKYDRPDRSSPTRLWQSVEGLLRQGHLRPSDSINAKLFHRFLEQYVSGLRSTTADSPPPPLFTATWAGCMFDVFHLVGVDDVMTAVRGLPDKQNALDPLPNKLYTERLCRHSGFFLTDLFNHCLACGEVPMLFEESFLMLFSKKVDLKQADVKNYRPVSNLLMMPKLLERLAVKSLLDYLNKAKVLPSLQSSSSGASQDTDGDYKWSVRHPAGAVAPDIGDLTMLKPLRLSAVLDTVDRTC